MKRTYEKPTIDLVELEEKDIIITSGELRESWDLTNDNDYERF